MTYPCYQGNVIHVWNQLIIKGLCECKQVVNIYQLQTSGAKEVKCLRGDEMKNQQITKQISTQQSTNCYVTDIDCKSKILRSLYSNTLLISTNSSAVQEVMHE